MTRQEKLTLIKEKRDNILERITNIPKLLLIVMLLLGLPLVTTAISISIIIGLVLLMWILFPERTEGVKRGLAAFVLYTLPQIFIVLFSYVLIGFNDSGDELTFLTILAVAMLPLLFLTPIYLAGYKLSGLKIDRLDGIMYITSIIFINIILKLIVWLLLWGI